MAQKKQIKKPTAPKNIGRKGAAKPPEEKTTKQVNTAAAAVRARDEKKQRILTCEIQGILIIACGLFLLLAFLTETAGTIGSFLKNLCYGLLGPTSAISCVFVILTGYQVFVDKEGRGNKSRAFLLGGLILSTSLISALVDDAPPLTGGLLERILTLWQDGTERLGGGVLGGGIFHIFRALLGVAGTWIVAICAELILGILLTGVSLTAMLKKAKKGMRRPEGEENPEEEKKPRVLFGKKEEKEPEKKKKSDFFEGYFLGDEPLGKGEGLPEEGFKEGNYVQKRFVFKEDDELLKDVLPPEEKENLPFTLDNMKTGTITELPVTKEDGTVETPKNPEDEEEFVPPTEAQLEDTPDAATKAAMDAGIALDRAVVAGRRMLTEEDVPKTPEEEIEEQLTESAAVPKRMMEYFMPTLDLLDAPKPRERSRQEIRAELEEKANRLLETLRSFKVEANIINITQGPSVTRFELQPGVGVKVSKITGLTDDIALSLAAPGVRIEAPIPGKSAIGVEIPNKEATPVPIREVLEHEKFQNFQSKTAFALGKDIAGSCVVADIAKFPHVLIAGQTGSGKSVCINSLILSILFKAKPDEVKLIMVDPKMVELGVYNGIPHLLIPVVTDPKHAAGALNWAVTEMQNRYALLKDNNVRNLKGYNALMEERGEPESKLPEIVIIIDEFADLMIAAKNEVEEAINRLAALARAAGMYLVIATQRPTANVITGVIKANIPSRIAFNVTSQIDSRVILDMNGAEKLLGRGDMLYNPSGAIKPVRIQGNFVSDAEIERVIDYIKGQYEAEYDAEVIENIQREQERLATNMDSGSHHEEEEGSSRSGEARDELFFQAVEMVLDNGQASVAMFQRRFKIGYQRAARLIDQMEERRIIGPYEGTKPRQVLISRQEFYEMRMNEIGE